MKIETMADYAGREEEPEILFWVGCAGSFDARAQKVTVAFTKILQAVGMKFAIFAQLSFTERPF